MKSFFVLLLVLMVTIQEVELFSSQTNMYQGDAGIQSDGGLTNDVINALKYLVDIIKRSADQLKVEHKSRLSDLFDENAAGPHHTLTSKKNTRYRLH